MYLDILGLVTTGVGNLIDPRPAALKVPFVTLSGAAATLGEIEEEWDTIKGHTELAHAGAGAAKKFCRLRLTQAGIVGLVDGKLTEMVGFLAKRFPELQDWPADAQLAVCSMAWAMGPGFKFPKFQVAVSKKDFSAAALQCDINAAGNPGVIPRNVANRKLFTNAARVIMEELDPEQFVELDPLTGK